MIIYFVGGSLYQVITLKRMFWACNNDSDRLTVVAWKPGTDADVINSASSPESLWLHVSSAWPSLMPRPLLLSTSICLMDRGGPDRGPCRLPTIHTLCHTHWLCLCYSIMLPSIHMASIAYVHPVALLKVASLVSPWKGFFYFLGVFPDPIRGPAIGMSYVYGS